MAEYSDFYSRFLVTLSYKYPREQLTPNLLQPFHINTNLKS